MACRPKGRGWVEISNEGADDCRLDYYLVFEDAVADFEARDETAGVNLEVPRLPWAVEGDDDFFVRDVEGSEGYMCPVSPGAAMVGVEGYWGLVSVSIWSVGDGG